jgi:hypothetical protein
MCTSELSSNFDQLEFIPVFSYPKSEIITIHAQDHKQTLQRPQLVNLLNSYENTTQFIDDIPDDINQVCAVLLIRSMKHEEEPQKKKQRVIKHTKHIIPMIESILTADTDYKTVLVNGLDTIPNPKLSYDYEVIAKKLKIENSPKVMIINRIHTNASGICHYTINRLLSQYRRVNLLDMNTAAPLVGITGSVSLYTITKPMIGPSCMNNLNTTLSYSRFFGHVSPIADLDSYLEKVMEVFVHYENDATENTPLVIHACDFQTHATYQALLLLIDLMEPTHIIKIGEDHSKFSITAQTIRSCTNLFVNQGLSFMFESKSETKKKKVIIFSVPQNLNEVPKDLQLYTYFARDQHDSNLSLCDAFLMSAPQYSISWEKLHILFLHGNEEIFRYLSLIHGMIVGLAIDRNEYEDYDPKKVHILRDMPGNMQTLGSGIVSSICEIEHRFHIITSIEPEQLQSINTIICGSIRCPSSLTTSIVTPYMVSKKSISQHVGDTMEENVYVLRKEQRKNMTKRAIDNMKNKIANQTY